MAELSPYERMRIESAARYAQRTGDPDDAVRYLRGEIRPMVAVQVVRRPRHQRQSLPVYFGENEHDDFAGWNPGTEPVDEPQAPPAPTPSQPHPAELHAPQWRPGGPVLPPTPIEHYDRSQQRTNGITERDRNPHKDRGSEHDDGKPDFGWYHRARRSNER